MHFPPNNFEVAAAAAAKTPELSKKIKSRPFGI
jgi:hypothetical protein